MPFEYTCAYLLGLDAQPFLDEPLGRTVTAVLDRLSDPDAEVVRMVAREKGRLFVQDEQRIAIFELFRWYRLGTRL